MSDHDRGDPPPVRETERTTVVHTESRRGGGLAIALVVIVAVLALLFFLFGGNLNRGSEGGNINIDVDAPEVTLPDVDIPEKIEVPNLDIAVDKEEPAESKQ